jgi:alkane 1-monooxygenase
MRNPDLAYDDVCEWEAAMATARVWAMHLLCFILPGFAIAFLATGPHGVIASLLWFGFPLTSIAIDLRAGPERRQPTPDLPEWPFDAILYAQVVAQLVSVGLLVHHASVWGLWRVDTAIGVLLVGINSGWSAIVVAHELIHRKARHLKLLGRLLLVTVVYDHFATEHVRGHHARIGTPEDGATARFGEPFWAFLRRTVPQQFASAWALDRRAVVQGLVAAGVLCVAIAVGAGPAALIAFALQAALAVLLLEAVNWFEHWGLTRSKGRVTTSHSWDTESWFTLYALVGLSRHADHHAYANRPYSQLRHTDASPKLPHGYLGMVVMALFADARVRRAMVAELERRRLGPFAEAT